MADSLFLRKGLLANLEAAPKVAGAISITTDERAMYLDLSDTERIRIGDFIQVANVTELESDKYKPWSTTAFYYVEDVNGLYKYNGTGWKLINEKSDFSSDIDALETDVATNKADIATLKTNVAGKTTAIATEKSRAEGAEADLQEAIDTEKERAEGAEDALGKRIDTTNTNVSSNTAAINTEKSRAEAAESTLQDNINKKQDTITGAATTIVANNLTAGKVLVSNADGKVAINELDASKLVYLKNVTSDIQDQIGTINTNHSTLVATVSNLDTAYKAADTAINEKITALQNADSGINDELERIESEYKAADTTINNSITVLQTKNSSQDTEINDIKTRLDVAEGGIADLEELVGAGSAGALADAKTYTDEKVASEASARSKAISDLETAYKAADSTLTTKVNEASAAVATEKTRAETEEGKIRSEFAAADTALETKITTAYETYVDSKLQAADAMIFKGVVTNADQLGVIGNDAGEAVGAGWTYKAGGPFTYNNEQIHAGDLLIADADQEGETYTGGWSHVASGYEDDYAAKLNGDATAKSVTLLSGIDVAHGKIIFADNYTAATGGVQINVAVSTDNPEGDTVTVSANMVWGSF